MDLQVILFGIFILGVAIGAILFIKSLKPPKNFREFKEEVQSEFIRRGFASDYFYNLPERRWRDWFNEGLTAKESIEYYFDH